MAELVGVVAGIVGLAGAAAKVSLALFECGRNLASARIELENLAGNVSDLSTVLEHLVDVLKKYESQVAAQTIETVSRLVTRCEKVLEELKVAAELVKSRAARFKWLFRKPKTQEHNMNLEGFKSNLSLVIQTLSLAKSLEQESKKEHTSSTRNVSVATQRNINLLRSFVLNNKGIMHRLKAAKCDKTGDEDLLLLADEKQERDKFRTELDEALVQPNEESLIRIDDILTWEKVLLRSYEKLSEQPPVSEVLISTIPEQIREARATEKHNLANPENENSDGEEDSRVEADKEVIFLLNEWTSAPKSDIDLCLQDHRQYEQNLISGIPRWVQDEYTFDGYDPQNPAHWKPKASAVNEDTKILPHSRFAYELPDTDQAPLFNVLVDEGGAWVWRHENDYQRDYFVGSKKVLQYFVKPFEEPTESIKIQDRTIVGKQWVSRDILQKVGLEYQDYGGGDYSIAGKLKPAEVQYLHEAASYGIEEELRSLATEDLKPKPTRQESRPKALALLSHTDSEIGYLSFKKGDLLELDGKPSSTDGWWSAFLRGERGIIPCNNVRIITDDEAFEINTKNATSAAEGSQAATDDPPEAGGFQTTPDSQTTEAENERLGRLERWKARFDRARREATETWNAAQREAKESRRVKIFSSKAELP